MTKFSLSRIVFIFIFYYPISAYAGLITYEFSGVFSRSVVNDPLTTADASIGDVFLGQFTYNDEQPLLSIITQDTRARYNTGEILASTGANNYNATNNPQLQIFNNWEFSPGGTAIDDFFLSVEQYDSSGTGFYLLQLNLRDYTKTKLDSLYIPITEQVEDLASGGQFFLRRFASRGREEWWADGAFSSIKQVSVPEPSSIYLLLFGFILITYRTTVLKKTHNKKLNKDQKQLAFCSLRSLILANYFLPVN
jgi:hypothetical protein